MGASKIIENIFTGDNFSFETVALQEFHYQYNHNPVYHQFVQLNKVRPGDVQTIADIPFLPVEFFKTRRVLSGNGEIQQIFESSGTTGQQTSKHYVADTDLYRKSFRKGFELFYGEPSEWNILALLPSYLEREHSSLVFMVNDLIQLSGSALSGFYLDEWNALSENLQKARNSSKKTMLIGVTFALLDLAEKFPQDLSHCIIMETGGMKGRKEELLREEVHTILKNAFRVNEIHSEYGMTELLSQAYSKGNGIFQTPPWMKILRREINDAKAIFTSEGRGIVNVIDLANIYSCSFIATQDMVYLHGDGSFEILGRSDNSDLRGCNLMVSSY